MLKSIIQQMHASWIAFSLFLRTLSCNISIGADPDWYARLLRNQHWLITKSPCGAVEPCSHLLDAASLATIASRKHIYGPSTVTE
jgi:hypothetical protein